MVRIRIQIESSLTPPPSCTIAPSIGKNVSSDPTTLVGPSLWSQANAIHDSISTHTKCIAWQILCISGKGARSRYCRTPRRNLGGARRVQFRAKTPFLCLQLLLLPRQRYDSNQTCQRQRQKSPIDLSPTRDRVQTYQVAKVVNCKYRYSVLEDCGECRNLSPVRVNMNYINLATLQLEHPSR